MSRSLAPLFRASQGEIRTIPAGADFLRELAKGLYEALADPDDPFALADAVVYLPNRRSAQALADHFYEINDQKALLLPKIRALGDLDPDDAFSTFGVAIDDLPPAISEASRLGHLGQLVQAFQSSRNIAISPTSALNCAKELANLLDQIALAERVDWSKIDEMLAETDLAQHWQDSARFLSIILDQWPVFLSEVGLLDPATHQRRMAEKLSDVWRSKQPKTPIIIAGSTGATAPTRSLMSAALTLPNGLVVLPGLNTDLTNDETAAISNSTSHPQFAMTRTLRQLNAEPRRVQDWPKVTQDHNLNARRRLIHEALAPAELTASWGQRSSDLAKTGHSESFVESAASGLVLIEAKTETEEAEIAALLLREGLNHPERKTALVTLDMGLALRVSALLRAQGIDCPPSSGRPALHSPIGRITVHLAELLCDPTDPLKLLTCLQHELSLFDRQSVLDTDKYALRGPRLWDDMAGLKRHAKRVFANARCKATNAEITRVDSLLEQLAELLTPIQATLIEGREYPIETFVQLLMGLIESWTGPEVSSDLDDAVPQRLTQLIDLCGPLGPMRVSAFVDMLRQDLLEQMIPPSREHPRLAIWGPLEARLQSADHVILAGLNEHHWPQQPSTDSFLSRRFRAAIGLTDPDERIGLSAHDFAQLACNANTTLLSAERRDGKPAVASRWLWRLRMLLRGAAGEDVSQRLLQPAPEADPRLWLAHSRARQVVEPIQSRPAPCPPENSRPRRLSVTRIEALIRDPYAIYCENILGLSPLEKLGQLPDARHRGTAIHAVLDRFEQSHGKWSEGDFAKALEFELRASGVPEIELLALRERRRAVISDFLNWRFGEAETEPNLVSTEIRGVIHFNIRGAPFELTGVADRIEHHPDGSVEIQDFKMGAPPSFAQVKSGLSPQLPLLALIAIRDGFPDLGRHHINIADLAYIRFGTQFDVRRIGEGTDIEALVAKTEAGVKALLEQFATPSQPYLSAPRPQRLAYPSEYARLARMAEWAENEAYD